jgi:hypothetical protein
VHRGGNATVSLGKFETPKSLRNNLLSLVRSVIIEEESKWLERAKKIPAATIIAYELKRKNPPANGEVSDALFDPPTAQCLSSSDLEAGLFVGSTVEDALTANFPDPTRCWQLNRVLIYVGDVKFKKEALVSPGGLHFEDDLDDDDDASGDVQSPQPEKKSET